MKTGDTIEHNGVMLEAVAEISGTNGCEGCYFWGNAVCPRDEKDNLLCISNDNINIFKEVNIMTHKIFKVINFYYIHLDDKKQLCPLADYISENNPEIEVLEVRYNPQAEQGVVIVKTDDYQAYARLNNVVDLFKNDII